MLAKTLASQLRQPYDRIGQAVARFLSFSDYRLSTRMAELLAIQPHDRVLQIGFGGGFTLERVAARAYLGKVSALVFSESVLRRGQRLFREQIERGHIELLPGQTGVDHAEDLPFPSGSFDKVCSVDTIYSWDDARKTMGEIRRVLKSNGRFVLPFPPLERIGRIGLSRSVSTLYDYDDIDRLMREAGFGDTHFDVSVDGGLALAVGYA